MEDKERILRVAFLGWSQEARCLWELWKGESSLFQVVGVVAEREAQSGHGAPGDLPFVSSILELRRLDPVDLLLDFTGKGWQRPSFVSHEAIWLPKELSCLLGSLCVARQQGLQYREVIETATDAVVTIDESHRILFFNKAAEAMFGYSKEEALGQDLSLIIPKPHKEKHREYVARYVETRRGRLIDHTVELTAERRSGEKFPISISFSVAEVGDHLLMTAVMRDMSDIKAMERELIQNERLASIGRALSFVTHEVKNPLVVIGGFARSLLRGCQLPDEERHKLEIIRDEVQRLEALLQEIQDFSKPMRLQRQRIRTKEFLEELASLFRDVEASRGITVEVLTIGDPVLWADPDRLRQVVLNLVKNSMEAIKEKGKVTLKAETHPQGGVTLWVEDTGPGVDEERIEELFQPFVTTKPGGTGLGLPLCRKIVRDHGGEIEVKRGSYGGAVVRMWFPQQGDQEDVNQHRERQ